MESSRVKIYTLPHLKLKVNIREITFYERKITAMLHVFTIEERETLKHEKIGW